MSGLLYFCPGCCKTRFDDPAPCRSCGSETFPYVPQFEAQNWFERASEYAAEAADANQTYLDCAELRNRHLTGLRDAESVLREIQENASSVDDPHFRHWANATVLSYFSAKEAVAEVPLPTAGKGWRCRLGLHRWGPSFRVGGSRTARNCQACSRQRSFP